MEKVIYRALDLFSPRGGFVGRPVRVETKVPIEIYDHENRSEESRVLPPGVHEVEMVRNPYGKDFGYWLVLKGTSRGRALYGWFGGNEVTVEVAPETTEPLPAA